MMSVEKLSTGLSYVALGAFAAYLGLWWTEAGRQPHILPMLIALAMGMTGMALLSRSGRRLAHPASQIQPARRLESQEAREVRVDEARQGDAALLGHEIKNYLCTLKGSAGLLRQRAMGRDRDIIDRIDRVVDKLESFTKTLSSTADATSSGLLRHLEMGDEAKVCVRTHFHPQQGGFRWNIRPDAPTLLGDPDRLEQVFLNLYANAFEAGAEQVMTTVSRDGGRLHISIEDDGKGCAPEDLERIFEPFFSTKSGPARRGLGMFIVQSIVENHGGRIKVRSKNATGSHGLVFVLDFPISLPVSPATPPAKPLTAPSFTSIAPFGDEAGKRLSARQSAVRMSG